MSELGSLLKKNTVILQDEGTTLGAVPIVNITGAGATASISGAVGTINIPGGGGVERLPFRMKALTKAQP